MQCSRDSLQNLETSIQCLRDLLRDGVWTIVENDFENMDIYLDSLCEFEE